MRETLDALDRQYDQVLVDWEDAQDRCGGDPVELASTNAAYLGLLHANLRSRLDVIEDSWQDSREARRRRLGLDPLLDQPADADLELDALDGESGAPGIEDGRADKPRS
ncbi:MAG: hypothetical protein IT431_05270 [Phycisphaerales bacterium]|nr:hypothetical protein [Phycisphaerales bacterium]